MIIGSCEVCGIGLEVEENDTTLGNREMEEVICPNCKGIAMKVFTSGIPTATIRSEATK